MAAQRKEVCKHGHVRAGRTKNGTCNECNRLHLMKKRRAAGIPPRRIGMDMEKRLSGYRRRSKCRRLANPAADNARVMLRHASKLQRTPTWADLKKIQEVYKVAKQMQRDFGVKMAVDHVIPLRGEAVSGLHVHENLRVLPFVENCKKYNSYKCV